MECPVCLENFSTEFKPMILPCGHTICYDCVVMSLKKEDIECPTCRTVHRGVKLETLVVNYAVL